MQATPFCGLSGPEGFKLAEPQGSRASGVRSAWLRPPHPERECLGVPYLPAVKQVPLAAPMVENATKSGTTQEAG